MSKKAVSKAKDISQKTPMTEWLARLVIASITLIGGLIVIEVALRNTHSERFVTRVDHLPAVVQADEQTGYRHIPNAEDVYTRREFVNHIRINEQGWYDYHFTTDYDTLIAVIGDSFSAGMQVSMDQNFPNRLEKFLTQQDPVCRCEVYNFGVFGTGILQQYEFFVNDILPYKPDIVVLQLYANDIDDVAAGFVYRDSYRGFIITYRTDQQRQEMVERVDTMLSLDGQLVNLLIRRTALGATLYETINLHTELYPDLVSNQLVYPGMTKEHTTDEALEMMSERIIEMNHLCEEQGCTLVTLVLPSRPEASSGELALAPVIDRVEDEGIHVLSLEDVFARRMEQGELLFWESDGHYNAWGYQIVAQELQAFLLEEDLIQ